MTRRTLLVLLACTGLAPACTTGTVTCDKPFTACSTTVCARLLDDPQHCGSCGNSCATGMTCVEGTCACPVGSKLCGSLCASISTDPLNCGGCGVSCNGQQCLVDATTKLPYCGCPPTGCACPQGQSMVGGVCTATVFAACFNTGELVAMDDDLNKQAASVKVGGGPWSIAYGGGHVLIADTLDNALYNLDPKVLPLVESAGGDRLDHVISQVVVKGDRAYVVSSGDNLVQVLDLAKPATANIANARTVDEIPTSAATPPAPANTNPAFLAFAGDKLYVSLGGTCDATGDAAGNRLLQMDVSTTPGKVVGELVFKAADYVKDAAVAANSARPAGLAAVGSKLYVAIGNLTPDCLGSAGPAYLAVVDTTVTPLTSKAIKLPDECRNPTFVVATATRVYVSCSGTYKDWSPFDREAVVLIDPTSDLVIKSVTFPPCPAGSDPNGPAACKVVVPGRMALHGTKLLIADSNSGRLLVTDLDGNLVKGFESGLNLCPLKCPGGSTQPCSQMVSDVFALH